MEAMMKDEMYAEIVTVTPEIAEEWLKKKRGKQKCKNAQSGYVCRADGKGGMAA